MKTRFTITCYDEESLNDLVSGIITIKDLVESTEETGHCVLVYSNDTQAYTEKTKAGYKCTMYRRKYEEEKNNK